MSTLSDTEILRYLAVLVEVKLRVRRAVHLCINLEMERRCLFLCAIQFCILFSRIEIHIACFNLCAQLRDIQYVVEQI